MPLMHTPTIAFHEVVTFSITSSHRTAPEDVLQEVVFYHGGAEVGDDYCWGEYEQPALVDPDCVLECSDLELKDTLLVASCGWQRDESVRMSMKFPDGDLISKTQRATWVEQDDGSYLHSAVVFSYTTDLKDPPGLYTFIFEGESGRLEHTFNVVRPAGPRLYEEKTSLLLHNFEPNERVRLFAYAGTAGVNGEDVLANWQEYQVDSSGQLMVKLQIDEDMKTEWGYEYVVLGNSSGECNTYPPFPRESIIRARYVVADPGDDESLDVIASCSWDSDVIRQVASGTRMEVIGTGRDEFMLGALCWHVHLNDGTEGWVSDVGVKRIAVEQTGEQRTEESGVGGGIESPNEDKKKELNIPVEVFSISSSHQSIPEDILLNVTFFAGGGAYSPPTCWDSYQYPSVNALVPPGLPPGLVSVFACGWQPYESVHMTMKFPDGRSVSKDLHATSQAEGYLVAFDYVTTASDPTGLYTFLFEGEDEEVQISYWVEKPTEPHLLWYWYFDEDCKGTGKLLLYGFKPNERIHLFAYEAGGVLVAWQEFQVNSGGQLAIQSELSDFLDIGGYAAVGSFSGEAIGMQDALGEWNPIIIGSVLANYVVADTGSDHLNVREGPGYDYSVIEKVISGTRMWVLQSSTNDDGELWWYVCLKDGTEGWVVDDWVIRLSE